MISDQWLPMAPLDQRTMYGTYDLSLLSAFTSRLSFVLFVSLSLYRYID